jgi:hypothetical protein
MNNPNYQFVAQCEFNQAHCPDLIGVIYKPYNKIPAYVRVQNLPNTLHAGFDLMETNWGLVLTNKRLNDISIIRTLIDELNIPGHVADEMLQFWSTTLIRYKAEEPYFKEWVIKKCFKSKL